MAVKKMKINENFVLKKIGDDYVLLPIGQEAIDLGGLLRTNEVGFDIFDLLKRGLSVDECVNKLLTKYQVEYDVLHHDVYEFYAKLVEYGVINNED